MYIIDWEVARPAYAEVDIGEITGVGVSFARRYGVQDVYPFIPALHRAYSRHRALDPVRIATAVGIDTLGFGTILRWARNEDDSFFKEVVKIGFELLELVEKKNEGAIRTKSFVKHLFSSDLKQDVRVKE